LIGRALSLQNRNEEAVAALRRSLQRRPDYSRARVLLARTLLRLRRESEAAEQYEQMIRRRPDDALANVWYGEYRSRLGDWNGAADYFQRALERDPDSGLFAELLGTALEKTGRSRAATELYREQTKRYPRRLHLADRLAWLLATHPDAALRDGEEAARIAEKLCRAAGYRNAALLDTLAAARAEQGRYEEAVKAVRRAVGLARQAEDRSHAAALEQRLALYRNGQPFRDAERYAAAASADARRSNSSLSR
jgi:tetratricopeptide (TPR) repeat protein